MLIPEIRFCGKEDAAQVLAVDKTSLHPWPESVIVGDLGSGDAQITYIGAFAPADGSTLLGYSALGEEKGNGLLMNLIVMPQYRRRGVGAQLTVAAAELAYSLGFRRLALRVRLTNHAALNLYRGLGFTYGATRGGFYSDGGAAGSMSLRLPLDLGGE